VRYPIRMKLLFNIPHPKGGPWVGCSIDISSHGILFSCAAPVTVGQVVEGSIVWPVPQAGGMPVKLLWNGTVVRRQGGLIALQIATYEFRAVGAPRDAERSAGRWRTQAAP
jgi:hypothetical protein